MFSSFCFPGSLFPFSIYENGKLEKENGDWKPFSGFLFHFHFWKNETGKQKTDVENQKRESGRRCLFFLCFSGKEKRKMVIKNRKQKMDSGKRFHFRFSFSVKGKRFQVLFFCFFTHMKKGKTENEKQEGESGRRFPFFFPFFSKRKMKTENIFRFLFSGFPFSIFTYTKRENGK